MTSRLVPGPSEVIITSDRATQTIVNPPGKPRTSLGGAGPHARPGEASEVERSWSPRHAEWLLARSGDAPVRSGSRQTPPATTAPGRYVLE